MSPSLRVGALLGCLLLAPTLLYAQTQASITGSVKDTSGAVLPGVTVEASSPELIEKVRGAVTDATGQYRIENLRPGRYTVTFTLAGFSTVRRGGGATPTRGLGGCMSNNRVSSIAGRFFTATNSKVVSF